MYSTSRSLSQLIPSLIAKSMVTPGTVRVRTQLVWMDIPRWSYYRARYLNGLALLEPTDVKAGLFAGSIGSWKCLRSRRENRNLPAYLEGNVWLGLSSTDGGWELPHHTNSNKFCSSWWHEGFQCALKRNWYRQSVWAVTDVPWTLE